MKQVPDDVEVVEPARKPGAAGAGSKSMSTAAHARQSVVAIRTVLQGRAPEQSHSGWLSALLIALLLVCLGIWAHHATLEEVASGTAKIIPSSRIQLIQSLEGGILMELNAREGDIVEKGSVLLQLDPTRANSSFLEGRSKLLALSASASRLRAEATGAGSIDFDPEVRKDPALMASERATFATRRRAIEQSVAGLRKGGELLRSELQITEPLVARGLASEVEALRLRRQLNEIESQMGQVSSKFQSDAASELAKVQSDLSQIEESLPARRDLMERTVMKAPVRGTVKNIRITTLGGVVQPGQDIMEIVPLEGTLLVETKIRPAEVAFLRPGLSATVKISAYDSQIYGSLKGKVEFISPDTLREDRKPEEETYYRVLVRTDSATLTYKGNELPVIPGMTAVVDILTGERTVAEYLLKPVLRIKDAFREK
jgi:adhesin transport system membrane fusion protein